MPKLSAPVWTDILEIVRAEVCPQRFDTWFGRIALVSAGEGELVLGVPNLFHREWLESRYRDTLARAAEAACGEPCRVQFVVDPALFKAAREEARREGADLVEQLGDAIATPPRRSPSLLNPDMRLESFVVGACNRVAFEAACAAADSPGAAYNPLFIHGGCGVGKTHLLQGVCHRFLRNNRSARGIYITGESFSNQFVAALRTRQLDAFRHRFRETPLLAIDDVHFLASKNRTQDELLHTFDALQRQGSQIMMASDQPPRDIRHFKDNLLTRFMAGMVAELKPPSRRVRLDIVTAMLGRLAERFDPAALDFVIATYTASVRDLQGAVATLQACAALTSGTVTMPVVRQALAAIRGRRIDTPPTAQHILRTVAAHYDLSVAELTGGGRAQRLARPRQMAMHLMREMTGASFKEIGRIAGVKNHTTAISACRRIQDLLETTPALRDDLQTLTARIRTGEA